jgi:hypothetical protein
MADGDGVPPSDTPSSGQQHSGVIRRSEMQRPKPSTGRRDWLALVAVATLMVIVLVAVTSFFGGKSVANPSSSPTLVANASATPSLKPTYSAEPTRTPSPSPTPSPTPYPTPTPSPTPSPTPTPSSPPTPAPTPSPPPLPTPPAAGLIIFDPVEGSTVPDRVITVSGMAQPGAPITQDVPFWFDNHTSADDSGLWSFNVELNVGWNALKFRVGDDVSTQVTLNVYFAG